jgi:hypothetical protein
MQMSRKKSLKAHRKTRRQKPKNWCFVYGIKEREGAPYRYIGQTRLLPSERLRWHYKEITRYKQIGRRLTRFKKWLISLREPPIIEVIDENGVWDTSEAVWIERYLVAGHPLFNLQSVVPPPVEPIAAPGAVLWEEDGERAL